jgi:hypothetical protein
MPFLDPAPVTMAIRFVSSNMMSASVSDCALRAADHRWRHSIVREIGNGMESRDDGGGVTFQ